MYADSNVSYKEIFGNLMLDVVRSHDFMPEEIYSEKGNTADDCSPSKSSYMTLFGRQEPLHH